MREENDGRVRIKSPEFPRCKAAVPQGAITQVVLDLLDNAAEANESKCACVKLNLQLGDEYICFSVEDEGPGFPEEVLKNLGEPFNSQKIGERLRDLSCSVNCSIVGR